MNREYLKARCFEDEDENWWQRRSGMERCLFAALIVAIIFSLACVIYIALQILLTAEVCSNPTCLSESYKIISHINNSVDPCEDFLEYVCGERIAFEELHLSKKLKGKINEMLTEEDSDGYNATKDERKLFQNCVNQTGAENFLPTFLEVLEEIGGWPVIVGYRWRARLFEWTEAIYSLKSRGYPFSMFLSAKLETESRIKLSIVSLKFPHRDLYLQFMIDTAVIFGADRYQATLQMENVIEFMEELKEVTRKNITMRKQDDIFATNVTVDEMQKIYDEIQWLEFLNNLLYPYTVTDSDIVVIPGHKHFGEFFDLITAVSKRVQANYMVWKVIEEMIPFMSKRLQYLKANYTCQVEDGTREDGWDFCSELLDASYVIRPLQLLYTKKRLPVERKIMIEELLLTMKMEMIRALQTSKWIEDESRQASVEFFETIDVVIGAPNSYFNSSIFEELYTWELEGESIFEMVLSARKNFFESLMTVDNSSLVLSLVKGVEIAYAKVPNTIVIPLAVIDEYFDDKRPMYLNYAELGVAIGEVLLEALVENVEDFWGNSTLEEFKERLECADGNHLTGTQLGYQAYRNWAESRDKEAKLIAMNQTPNQLFWISAVSSSCSKYSQIRPNQYLLKDFMCSYETHFDDCDVL